MMPTRSVFAVLLLLFSFAGCTAFGPSFEPGNALHVHLKDASADGARQSYPVTVRIAPYTDGRDGVDSRQVGIATVRIMGFIGKELMLDREVASLVGDVMRQQLAQAGLQVADAEAKNAQFQLAGSIKALSVDVKDRDYLNIVIESTLTEVASGKVIWSGVVAEIRDRYAGVSGNNKEDVANYLHDGLQAVAAKTSESLLSVLMSARSDLFGLNPVAKPLQGVTVYSNSIPASVPPVAVPAPVTSKTGVLIVVSVPARARLYIDDVYYGLTPLRIDLAPGIYPVRLEMEGYKPFNEKVSVRNEDHTELEMKLRK